MIIQRQQQFPVITKNLIIINTIFFAASYFFEMYKGIDLAAYLGAFYPDSQFFKPFQIITHMFMHGSLMHLFFNMFSLYIFGTVIEQRLGTKNYVILYIVAGLGSFLLYTGYHYYEVHQLIEKLHFGASEINQIKQLHFSNVYTENADLTKLSALYTVPMVGASGAIFGIMVAFAVFYPDVQLQLIFPPIAIKAKYFIPIMMLLELGQQIANNPNDNVAHLAHLGGGIFGFFYCKYLIKKRLTY